MNQTLFITQEDLGDNMITLIKIEVEKNITCRKLKIQYSQQQNIPSNYLIIILNDQVLCDDDKVEQSEKDKLLIKDVRAMYKELESHLSKGQVLRENIKNKDEQSIMLVRDLNMEKEKTTQLESDLGQTQIALSDQQRQCLQLGQQLQSDREQFQNTLYSLQSEIAQLKKQNENLSIQIQEHQSYIKDCEQKIATDTLTIEGYNQYFSVFNSECNQIYGYQYQPGLLTHFKDESDKYQLSLQQQIATVQQDYAELEEQIAKNKTESDKKLRKLNQEKVDLEQDMQNTKELVEKEKKNQNRYLAEINSLKQKLKSSEDELQKQLDSLGQSEEQKNQQLKDQNRQLQRQIEAITQENYQLKQTEQEYHNLQKKYKSKAEQYKQAQQQFENTQAQLTDQINKLTLELINLDWLKQKLESQQEVTTKQSVQQQQMIQQQYEELKQLNNVQKEENIKLTEQVTTLTRQLKDSQATLDEYQIFKQGGEKRTQELIQQNQSLKSQITDLQTEKLKLEQSIGGLNMWIKINRKVQENSNEIRNNEQIIKEQKEQKEQREENEAQQKVNSTQFAKKLDEQMEYIQSLLSQISHYKALQEMDKIKLDLLEQQFLISIKKNHQYEIQIQKCLKE